MCLLKYSVYKMKINIRYIKRFKIIKYLDAKDFEKKTHTFLKDLS